VLARTPLRMFASNGIASTAFSRKVRCQTASVSARSGASTARTSSSAGARSASPQPGTDHASRSPGCGQIAAHWLCDEQPPTTFARRSSRSSAPRVSR
jgi:hypothetical protein